MMNTQISIAILLLGATCGCRAPDRARGRNVTSALPVPPPVAQPSAPLIRSLTDLVDDGLHAEVIRMFEESHLPLSDSVPVRDLIAYLDALVRSGQERKLFDFMMTDRSPSAHDRDVAAWSLIQLGDLHLEKGDSKAALIEGYLRACLLFSDGTCMRERALEKTIHTLQLQGDARAEHFRKQLKAEFPEREAPQQQPAPYFK